MRVLFGTALLFVALGSVTGAQSYGAWVHVEDDGPFAYTESRTGDGAHPHLLVVACVQAFPTVTLAHRPLRAAGGGEVEVTLRYDDAPAETPVAWLLRPPGTGSGDLPWTGAGKALVERALAATRLRVRVAGDTATGHVDMDFDLDGLAAVAERLPCLAEQPSG